MTSDSLTEWCDSGGSLTASDCQVEFFLSLIMIYDETHWALTIIDVTHYAQRAAA